MRRRILRGASPRLVRPGQSPVWSVACIAEALPGNLVREPSTKLREKALVGFGGAGHFRCVNFSAHHVASIAQILKSTKPTESPLLRNVPARDFASSAFQWTIRICGISSIRIVQLNLYLSLRPTPSTIRGMIFSIRFVLVSSRLASET